MAPSIGRPKILVVDDAPENIHILMRTLKSEYAIVAATNGEKALRLAVAEPRPDLILLDIMMPDLDGYEVCRLLKQQENTRDIPVIFVTTLGETADETKGLELGAIDYIIKPISPPIVKARVRNHLEMKLAREALQKHNEILIENARLRDDVDRITRHDLKTPLAGIISLTNLLIQDSDLPPRQRELLRMIEESGYGMLELINMALDLYKMETGRYRLEPVPVNIPPLVQRIGSETRELIGYKKLVIKMMVRGQEYSPGEEFGLPGDESLYYSMLANLLKNAVEASPAGRIVTVSLDDRDRRRLVIHNHGAVPEAIREQFFEKYVTAGKKSGTGLGTYSARLIARTMGGDLRMETSDRDGTYLIFELPTVVELALEHPSEERSIRETPSETARPVHTDGMVLNSNINVLVVDDYVDMRRTTVSILRQIGFRNFCEAADGEAAMDILQTRDIGLVVSDWNMPKRTGFELLNQVRSSERLEAIPFIMITAEAELKAVQEAGKARVTDFIIKPFTADLMKKKVMAIFSGR